MPSREGTLIACCEELAEQDYVSFDGDFIDKNRFAISNLIELYRTSRLRHLHHSNFTAHFSSLLTL